MDSTWQQAIVNAIDEAFEGKKGVFLDGDTEPLAELAKLTPEQASLELPGAGNSVANQVKHLITTIAMHDAQFSGKPFPDLDWGADWAPQQLTAEEWSDLVRQLEDGHQQLRRVILEPVMAQDDAFVSACIMTVTHLGYHIGQIRHAAAYASQSEGHAS